MDTGLQCTLPPRSLAKKYKSGSCQLDAAAGKITCTAVGSGNVDMEGDALDYLPFDAT